MLVSIICVIDSENLPLSNSEVSCKLFIIVSRHVMDSMFASTVVDRGFKPSMFASTAVDRGFKPRSGQSKDYKISICCFSVKHTALRKKSKDWLAGNQNKVTEWSDMSTSGLLFQ